MALVESFGFGDWHLILGLFAVSIQLDVVLEIVLLNKSEYRIRSIERWYMRYFAEELCKPRILLRVWVVLATF